MSNSNVPSTSFEIREKKERYLELIAGGAVEESALTDAKLKKSTYIRLLLDDPDFAKQVEGARRHRAEVWIGEIAKNFDNDYDKDEVPSEKLKFDKLAFLAKADNPDRYSGSGKGINVSVNLGEFKLLPPEEAKRALANDPFAIEVEFNQIAETGEDLL